MRVPPAARVLYSIALLMLLPATSQSQPAPPAAATAVESVRPTSLTATIGDVLVRIDGTLLYWTLGRVEYKGSLMAIEGSVFATVMTYPGVAQHLGVAHVIEVP